MELLSTFFALLFAATSSAPLLGTQGISQLDQWRATTTPYSAITTQTHAKSIYAPYSHATTSSLAANVLCLTADTCITTWPSGGGGGGADFGQAWELTSGALAPTTTVGILVNASSTIGAGGQTTGLTISGGATTTGNSYVAGQFLAADGTAAAPAYAFNGGPDYGFYKASTVTYLSLAGSARYAFLTTQLRLLPANILGWSATTALGAVDLNISRNAAGKLQIGTTAANASGNLILSSLEAYATSTIGDGTQTGGLTISGGATTTGTLTLPSLTSGGLAVDALGQVYKAATTTFSTGLTYAAGNVTCDTASGSVLGCLSASDWTTFNNKQAAISATWPITLSGATLSWSGLATTSNPTAGNLLYSDGTTGLVPVATTSLTASSPLSLSQPISVIGSSASAFSIANAAADGSTKGAASFTANDFDATSGNIALDYTNGQAASGSTKGYLTAADWTAFNAKESALTFTYPLERTTNTISLAFGTTTSNTWAGTQTFGNSSTTNATSSVSHYFPFLATPAGTCLATDPTGKLIATTTCSGGSGTPGGSDTQIQFNNSGSFGGSSALVWDNSNTRLGVGTSTPDQTLLVTGSVSNTAGSGILGVSNTTFPAQAFTLRMDATNASLHLDRNFGGWSTALTVDRSNGNFGIGTTSPTGTLEVVNETDVDAFNVTRYITSSPTVGAGVGVNFQRARGSLASPTVVASGDVVGLLRGRAYDGSSFDNVVNIQMIAQTVTGANISGKILLRTSDTGGTIRDRVTIDENGFVGIGTTTPTAMVGIGGTGTLLEILDTAGSMVMRVVNSAVTLLGTWDLSGATVKQHTYSSFTYATSTSWTGTTTIPIGPAYTAESWSGVKCFTDTGTVNVVFSDGSNVMNLFNASTTVGTVTLSGSNTFTASEKRYVDVGTPASSPTKLSCTVDKIVNN